MFKSYYFKWYLIVTGVLGSATTLSLLLRHDSFNGVRWWEYPEYAFQLAVVLFVCWFVHGIFLLHDFKWLNSYSKHIVSNILATVSTFSISFILYHVLPKSTLRDSGVPFNSLSDLAIHLLGAFLASLVSYVVFYSVHTNMALQNSKLENEILEQEHLRAQLISLQQQISPHFLFNSLSTLKTLTNEQPTKNYIVQLASVYRYVLNFNQHYLTPLKDELTFIRSYLFIMTTRFEDSLQVTIDVPEEHLAYMIPPLSVQLLIENAIKHNMISAEHPLQISIKTNNTPALIVSNNLQLKKVAEESTKTGLNNITERYKLLVHKPIDIINDGANFKVILPLLNK